MEARARREGESGAVPSAKFLQARITSLSTTLIKRLENILAVALDENDSATDGTVPPSLTTTAVQQLQVDVESAALVRAAEEIMILTRTMKEIWLFGELNTLKQPDGKDEEEEARRKMAQDVKMVEAGFREFLQKYSGVLDGGAEGS